MSKHHHNEQSEKEIPANEEKVAEEVAENETESLREEVQKLKDTILRQAADAENLRKRLEKEKDESIKYASSRFAKDLLPVLDNFERVRESSLALQKQGDTDTQLKGFVDGVMLCEKELLSVFKKHGIEKVVVAEGDAFDHQYHQAMCELEDKDHPAGSIIKVFQSGYTHHDRLLRPAMVSVSKKS